MSFNLSQIVNEKLPVQVTESITTISSDNFVGDNQPILGSEYEILGEFDIKNFKELAIAVRFSEGFTGRIEVYYNTPNNAGVSKTIINDDFGVFNHYITETTTEKIRNIKILDGGNKRLVAFAISGRR